jgi:hypothetical protein
MSNKSVLAMMKKYGYELDNDGQVVIYTGLFEHSDGKLYNEPEEYEDDEYDDEDEEE